MTFTNQFSETPNHQHQRSKQTFFFLFFFLCFFHTDKKELQRLSLAWKTREKRKTLLVIEFCMGIFPHECNREGGAALLFWSNTTEETRRKKKKERKKKEGKKKKIKMTVTEIQAKMNDMLSVDCPPGPNILPHYYVINFQKGATIFYCLFLMFYFDNFSSSAAVYTALHGGYGLIWLMKHYAMRDRNWDRKTTVMGSILSFAVVLGPYWMAGYFTISSQQVIGPKVGFCTFICMLGVTIMMVSDAQKYFTLKYKKGLITEGMFTYIRHPNYLGEMLLYGGFATMAPLEYMPYTWGLLAFVWMQIFVPNMCRKERSMSRYPEWKDYVARSGFLLPPLSALKALV